MLLSPVPTIGPPRWSHMAAVPSGDTGCQLVTQDASR